MLNLRIARPETVIDLGRIPELAGISEWDGGVALGAMTRQRTAEQSELVQRRAPLVTRALANVGHVTIRNRGTIGGSIAHAEAAEQAVTELEPATDLHASADYRRRVANVLAQRALVEATPR